MRLTLRIWRQAGPDVAGEFETYEVSDVTHEMSFLELLDSLNEKRGARAGRLRVRLP